MGKGKRRTTAKGSRRAKSARAAESPAQTAGPRKPLPPWTPWAALGGLMLLHGFLLFGVFNPSPHSGGDNAGYLTLAYSLLEHGQYLDLYDPASTPHTKYPPGFALVLAGAMLLGARTWAQFKVLSGLAIFAAVGLSVAWAWRRRGWAFAVTVGVVLAVANAFLYASQWILSDPMFLALTFLALVAFDASRLDRGDSPGVHPLDTAGGADAASDSSQEPSPGASASRRRLWLAVGIAATVAAFFTRSAGLPLVVAAGAWFALHRRFRVLAVFGVAIGVPALLWRLRDQALGGPGYTGEFWMINPYQPALGQAGFADLVGRVVANATQYFGAHIPTGFMGVRGGIVPLVGVVLTALAVWGWAGRMRRPGVAELFTPMYLGLILLWPEVWSGDRFALPLFPLLLFYAGEALLKATARMPLAGRAAVVGLAAALLVVPALGSWSNSARQAEICRDRTQRGAFACYAPRMQEFAAAAQWTTDNLPDSAVVLTRKPRMFYALSGTPSRVFPFSTEPADLLATADSAGAHYVILDYLDNLASFYLIPILERRSDLFCTLGSFGGDARGISTELMGLGRADGPEAEADSGDDGTASVALSRCPPEMSVQGAPPQSPSSSGPGVVPLLAGLDEGGEP